MPSDRVLIEIFTAANLAGIQQAKAGIASLSAPVMGLNPAIVGLAAATGGAIYVGKMAVDNYRQQADAASNLEQAYAVQNDTLDKHRGEIEAFLKNNDRYIDSQYDAENAIAVFVRAGVNQKTTMALMGDALDLASLKHISLSEAAQVLLMATEGNTRGLRDLGFTSKDVTTALDGLNNSQERGSKIHDILTPKLVGGREKTDELAQAQNRLNQQVQNLSEKYGPPLVGGLAEITTGVSDMLDALSNSEPVFAELSRDLIAPIQGFRDLARAIGDSYNAFVNWTGLGSSNPNFTGPQGGARNTLASMQNSIASRQRGFAPGTSAFGKGGN